MSGTARPVALSVSKTENHAMPDAVICLRHKKVQRKLFQIQDILRFFKSETISLQKFSLIQWNLG